MTMTENYFRKLIKKGQVIKMKHYEWWTVKITDESGSNTWELKATSKENAIKQIEKEVSFTNSEKNLKADFWHRKARILKVDWESLQLDRIGYQRRW